MKLLHPILLIGLFLYGNATNAQNSVLWEISGNDITTPSYLMGTLKFIGVEEFFIPKQAKDSLAKCEIFAIEDPIDHHAQHELNKAVHFPEGKSLKTELTPADYDSVKIFFGREFDIEPDKFESQYSKLIPLALSIAMTRLSLGEDVLYYDIELLKLARENKIETFSLEPIEREAAAIRSFPMQDQVKALLHSIANFETQVVNEYGRHTVTRKISPGQWYQYFKQRIKIPKVDHVRDELPATHEIPSRLKQLRIFITRDVLAKVANKQYLYINLFEAPVLAFFIAFMVKYYNVLSGEVEYTFYNNQNIPVFFFMSVVVALFFGLTMSAEEIFRDRKILKREQFLHLSRSSYLSSKVIVMFFISAIQTILFILVGNYILEIPFTELRYWLILFTCTCFANMLGLNISASFNSAVTIYILIPILVIPQLLLSGVVISFDKFNPSVGKPVGIPVMGEVMASRWAFEAYMVTQFKDNPFEQQFYDLDKTAALAEYKRVYLIPKLESKLAYCLNHRSSWRNARDQQMVASLEILQNEIRNELQKVGDDKFTELNSLRVGKFDSTVYVKTAAFLRTLKQYYTLRLNRANAEKDTLTESLTSTPEKTQIFKKFHDAYVNEAVTDAVKNITSTDRIVEYDGKLIQKIYPIYMDDHRPSHFFDFSANLYQPTKHFAGIQFDTLYFNILVIWSMTLLLFITLYFDVLKNIIKLMEGNRRYWKRDRH